MGIEQSIQRFWDWFSGFAEEVQQGYEEERVYRQIDQMVLSLGDLNWEVGPFEDSPSVYQLVISGSGDNQSSILAQDLVSHAPNLANWKFFTKKPPRGKVTPVELTHNGREVIVDPSGWKFVFIRYPDNIKELYLHVDNMSGLEQSVLDDVGAVVIENAIGGKLFEESFDILTVSRDADSTIADKLRPVSELFEVFNLG